ncbi:MAG: hypothetical protein WBA17_00050, partial [Saprospiraceae bacterium]
LSKHYRFYPDDYASVKYRLHATNLHKTYTKWYEDNLTILSTHLDHPIGVKRYNNYLRRLAATQNDKAKAAVRVHGSRHVSRSVLAYIQFRPVFKVLGYFMRQLKKTGLRP